MRSLKIYRVLLRKAQKRETEQNIRISMRFFINLFHEEDKESIIKTLYYAWCFSNALGKLFLFGLFFIINSKLGTGIITVIISTAVCQLIIMINYKKANLNYKKTELEFFCSTLKISNSKKIVTILLEYFESDFLLYIIIYYTSTLIYQVYQSENILLAFINCTMLLVILSGINLYFICSKILKCKLINLLQVSKIFFENIAIKNEESIKLQQKNQSSIRLVIENQFQYYNLNRSNKIFVTFIAGSLIILSFLRYFLNINQNYINIVLFSFYPTLLNMVFIKILSESLLTDDITTANFYFIKRYTAKRYFMNSTFINLIQYTKLIPITWSIINIITNRFSWTSIVFASLSIFQWVGVCLIETKRCYNYEKYDFDDIKLNIQSLMMTNLFEDYCILGLPVIGCSFSILTLYKTNSINEFTLYMSIYTIIILLYSVFKYFREMECRGVRYK